MTSAIPARSARYSTYGPASVLSIVTRDVAPPAAGKVRVAVRVAGLNPADTKIREGLWPSLPAQFPAGIGREMAGVVEAVGEGVTLVTVGDEVFGNVAGSAIAQYVLTNQINLAHKPVELDWITAGGMSLVGQTAWDSVASQSVTAEDVVLVSAAAGGVGSITSQLLVRAGATVIGTASESNHEFLRSIGVIPVSYGPGLVDRVRAAAGDRTVTVVFDHHGAETIEAGLALGVDPSRINTIAADAEQFGVVHVGRGPINAATLEELARLVVAGELVFDVDSTYPLDEVVAAFEHLDGGHVRGKIVVTIP
ncbi:NADP-dependent oxidoreductase [Glaciihabitans arcticus]|uniref:NADP-dependent oxidoreductase n=1 Tax=Glaciihabitans arcticus TaxID=2668039 RepID=A0A4Q9GNZ1_9MICO|nr:NADP-dependent oxidoreductase [Glaciihabitans arcticus]TBN56415.1 NADP-dependent oxidoreductase [Glaciihabitans arcticus]